MRRRLVILSAIALLALVGVVLVRANDLGRARAASTRPELSRSTLDRYPIPRRDQIGRTPADNDDLARVAVCGRVTCDGVPVPDAGVYARLSPDATADGLAQYAAGVLAKSSTDAGGQYELQLPDRPIPYSVDVGCLVNGALRDLQQDIVVGSGTARVDFCLVRGACIRGIAVQRDGARVPGVTVLATRKHVIRDTGSALASPYLLDTTVERYADRQSDYHESRGDTDSRGAFVLTGLAPGRYVLTTDSFTWLPDPMLDVTTDGGDVLFTIVAAQGVTGSVVDAASHDPIPRFLVEVATLKNDEEQHVRAGTSMNGALRLSWVPYASDLPDVVVRVSAQGYLVAHRRVALGPACLTDTGLWELTRSPAARVIFAVRYDDGSPFERPLEMEYRQSQGGNRGSAVLTATEAGVYEGTMPAGEWFVRVRPTSWLGAVGAWRSEVRIRDRDEWHATVTIPLGATVTVSVPDGPGWSIMARSTFMTSSYDPEQQRTVFRDFPPGRWEMRLCRGGLIETSKSIDVHPGGHHDMSFD